MSRSPLHPIAPPEADAAMEAALGDAVRSADDVRRQIFARAYAELLEWCFRVRAAGPEAPDADVGGETVAALAEAIGLVRQALDVAGDAGASARVDRLLVDLGLAEPETDEVAVRLAEETARRLAAGRWSICGPARTP